MADDIGYMGMLAAGLTFLAMTLHLLIEKYNNDVIIQLKYSRMK
jgi:hypothetical protein